MPAAVVDETQRQQERTDRRAASDRTGDAPRAIAAVSFKRAGKRSRLEGETWNARGDHRCSMISAALWQANEPLDSDRAARDRCSRRSTTLFLVQVLVE